MDAAKEWHYALLVKRGPTLIEENLHGDLALYIHLSWPKQPASQPEREMIGRGRDDIDPFAGRKQLDSGSRVTGADDRSEWLGNREDRNRDIPVLVHVRQSVKDPKVLRAFSVPSLVRLYPPDSVLVHLGEEGINTPEHLAKVRTAAAYQELHLFETLPGRPSGVEQGKLVREVVKGRPQTLGRITDDERPSRGNVSVELEYWARRLVVKLLDDSARLSSELPDELPDLVVQGVDVLLRPPELGARADQ